MSNDRLDLFLSGQPRGRRFTLGEAVTSDTSSIQFGSISLPARAPRGDGLTHLRSTASRMREDGPIGAMFARTLNEFGDFAEGVIAECDAVLNR